MKLGVNKRFGVDVVVYASADFVARSIQLLALPVYTSFLSVNEFAQLALLTVSTSLFAMAANLGVNNAVQRAYFEKKWGSNGSAIVAGTGLLQLIFFISIFTLALILSIFSIESDIEGLFGFDTTIVILAFLFVLPDQIAQYTQDIIRLNFKPYLFLTVAALRSLFGVILGLWLLVYGSFGASGVIIGTLVGSTVAAPVGLYIVRKYVVFRFNRQISRELIKYGSPFVLVGASYWIFQSMDRWMLAHFAGLKEVGLFAVANKFAIIVSFATFAFNRAWAPYAFYMRENNSEYKFIISEMFSVWFFIISFLALGLSVFSKELLMVATPEEYWGASIVVSTMAAAMALDGTTIFTLLGISFAKKTFMMNYGTWIAAFVNTAMNLILLRQFGAIGAAFASLCSYAVLTAYFLWASQKIDPLHLEVRNLLFGLAVVVATVAAPWVLVFDIAPLILVLLKFLLLGFVILCAVIIGIFKLPHIRKSNF